MSKLQTLNTIKSDLENEKLERIESDSEEEESINLIVQNFSGAGDKRVEITALLSTIMAQRELDQQRIINLNIDNSELDKEIAALDTKLHYMKLDLNNAQIKIESLESEIKNQGIKENAYILVSVFSNLMWIAAVIFLMYLK
jgi:hypothetical protein